MTKNDKVQRRIFSPFRVDLKLQPYIVCTLIAQEIPSSAFQPATLKGRLHLRRNYQSYPGKALELKFVLMILSKLNFI